MQEFYNYKGIFEESEKSWTVDVRSIDTELFDLSVDNPNIKEKDPAKPK